MIIIISGLPSKDFVSEISSQLNIEDNPTYFNQRSVDTPSIIQIVGSVIEWLDLYKLVSIIFISTITREAAKELYQKKSQILKALCQASVKPLKDFVELIFRNKERIDKKNIHIIISLNIPDDYLGTNLQLQITSEGELAWQFANFILRADKIEATINDLMKTDKPPMAPISLIVNDDGSIIIKYMDSVDLERHEIIIV